MKRRDFVTTSAISAAGLSLFGSGLSTVAQASTKNKAEAVKAAGAVMSSAEKPIVKEVCSLSQQARSGVALGGIGTGSVELRKDGIFHNWSIFNNYPKGTGPAFDLPSGEHENPNDSNLFFIVRYQVVGEEPRLKLLQVTDGLGQAAMTGIIYYYPWMSAIEQVEYSGRFPFVIIECTDQDMPVNIEMESFSPFIPHDVKNSSLPAVYFNFKITSKIDKPVDVMILGTLRNNVGYDTPDRYFVSSPIQKGGATMVSMTCGGMDEKASSFGQQIIASLSDDSTYYAGWEHRHPYYEILLREKTLPNIDDTEGRNSVDKETGKKRVNLTRKGDARLFSTVGKSMKFDAKGQSADHSFLMTWNFPNQYAGRRDEMRDRIEGHYYSNFFNTAEEVADYAIANKENLTKRSKTFCDNFYQSDAPQYVLDQVNSQLNTFITSGRLAKDGSFGVQEGLAPSHSWGPVATIDVAMYGSVPALILFPELQKAMMRAHKGVQSPKGEIAHGLHKDFQSLEDGTAGVYHRLDLPGQYVMMTLRDFFWTNDKEYLEEMWPSVKHAIEYILNHRDFDGNQLPSMKGIECSYDNFPMYGMASYIVSQWLAAMKSAAMAAEVMGDTVAKKKYEKIFANGSRLMDEKLWNGKYYRLYNDEGGEKGDKDEGCLTDQIIGQWNARLSGLGELFDKEHIHKALESIMEMSYKEGDWLENCSWPEDEHWHPVPDNIWVDQANTPWTGVELAFASFLMYEGLYEEGLKVVKAVDDRYRRAGLYWDHQEFGGHYYRPMSAWAIVNAMLGFSANQQHYTFAPRDKSDELKLFFAWTKGTGHYQRVRKAEGETISISTASGSLPIDSLAVQMENPTDELNLSVNGKQVSAGSITAEDGEVHIAFGATLALQEGETLVIAS